MEKSYFKYWGKAKKDPQQDGPDYHLLAYHCLDVAAVAETWWNHSGAIRHAFIQSAQLPEAQTKAWVLFFIALHDYGKWDIRFQMKAPDQWSQVNPGLGGLKHSLSISQIKNYYHGPAGVYWLRKDFSERFEPDWLEDDTEDWNQWFPWIAAVGGHHGAIPNADQIDDSLYRLPINCDQEIAASIKESRSAWLMLLVKFYLGPANLSFQDNPPKLGNTSKPNAEQALTMLAGFCSISDWLGSSDYFSYSTKESDSLDALASWYEMRKTIAEQALKDAGLISNINKNPNIEELLAGHKPRQLQLLAPNLQKAPSLTIIEASTGSGKTETALAFAWELLAQGLADSIVFALPTQATANAMFSRLELAAPAIFKSETNLLLAHGKSNQQQAFINLKTATRPKTFQNDEEAWVQCGQWLSQSRKRVFLGQIGVCTIDQVLVSVLPIKHKFIRGFGVGRSVLIVDEVHAYDSYMYGLLSGVLEQQRLSGGSAILLSATLPSHQKSKLANAWECNLATSNSNYPLITQCSEQEVQFYDLENLPEEQPIEHTVNIELIENSNLIPDNNLLKDIISAVESGAQVCLICNLVDVAQNLYQQLTKSTTKSRELTPDQIDLFHSRYTFKDRQDKEIKVKSIYGKNPFPKNARGIGHLLIATQVVEQSLDIDFDWMITQLCPIDLLFQRLGRLHRHNRTRPHGFEKPLCTILAPNSLDYQLHAIIYGNSRVLWRTHRLLSQAIENHHGLISFPTAYREWIEAVYEPAPCPDEPEQITKSFENFEAEQQASKMTAKYNMGRQYNLEDTDSNAALLTRDGEMGINIVPYYLNQNGKKFLLDDTAIESVEPHDFYEAINLNTVSAPVSWSRKDQSMEPDDSGLYWVAFVETVGGLEARTSNLTYRYSPAIGLQRKESLQKENQ